MSATTPGELIKTAPMRTGQVVVVAVCFIIGALDGFDISSISFASPGISVEYGIDRGGFLGTILSAELLGMAFGSVLLGRAADSFGRHPILLFSIAIVTVGMLAVVLSDTTWQLLVCRVFTGLGIGGLLATSTALVAEFSNNKNRALSVLVITTGLPFGTIVGGLVLKYLGIDAVSQWRQIFLVGGIATALVFPLVLFFVPESVEYLSKKQPVNALARINKILSRLGHVQFETLAEPKIQETNSGFSALFNTRAMAIKSALVTTAFFFHMLTLYFLLKWIPKMVYDLGFEGSAGEVLIAANIGGILGAVVIGIASRKIDIWRLLFVCLIGATITITLFGQFKGSLDGLKLTSAIALLFAFSAVPLLYTLFTIIFPPMARASGTGFALGFGRGGAILAPIFGGILLGLGIAFEWAMAIMSCGSLLALVAVFLLRARVSTSAPAS